MHIAGAPVLPSRPMKRLLPLLLLFVLSVAAAQAPPTKVTREVGQLFSALEHSGCQFQRNGSWHDAAAASAHLRRKYDYLLKKGVLTSTERFIELAASKSSMTGTPYQVRCGGAPTVDSRTWFTRKLTELRARPANATP